VSDERQTILPHSSFGDPECYGCLCAGIHGEQAEIVCNECGAIVQTVPITALDSTLAKMELSLDVATAMCPHCRAVNLFPGFSEMKAFVCRECGRGVVL
jgi:hypothetical protein